MHKNNFDFLRLIFALSVIVTHTYPLLGFNEWEHDWLSKATHGQATMAFIGVRGFFIISGYLVYQSMLRSRGIPDYLWKRFLRLYPALIVMLALTVLLAVFPYVGNANEYFRNGSALSYLKHNLLLFDVRYTIEGVFTELPSTAINGSLWTIPYEVFFYLVIGVLLFFRKMKWKMRYVVVGLVILMLTALLARDPLNFNFFYLDGKYILELGIYFFSGSLLAAMQIEHYAHRRIILFGGVFLLLASFYFHDFQTFQFFCLPLVVVPFGLMATPVLRSIGSRIGDLSYGIYIYGYPVQQTLLHYVKLTEIQFVVSSILVTTVLAYLSWHLVEKRALRLKHPGRSTWVGNYRRARRELNEEEKSERIYVGKGRL